MKYCASLILFIIAVLSLKAQDATVRSFEANPIDLAAQKYQRKDLHGNVCALVKVQVIAEDVECRGSVIGDIVKHPGEYWVYMPGGTKMVKIMSKNFLPLMYYFPEPLLGGVTYILVLEAPQLPGGVAPVQVNQAYLVVNVTPENAVVKMDGESFMSKHGTVTRLLRNGSYTFSVEAPGYFPETRTVNIDGVKVTENVALRSSKSKLTINATTPGTEIFINDECHIGRQVSEELTSGLYNIEGKKDGYRTANVTVDLAPGETREVTLPALEPLYGALNVEYEPEGAIVTVDSKYRGMTPDIITKILAGKHEVEISKPGYEYKTLTVGIKPDVTSTVSGVLQIDDDALKPFEKDGKYGYKYYDEIVVAPKYDEVDHFYCNFAKVRLNNLWGIIDKAGREVISPQYDDVRYVNDIDTILVNKNELWGVIDKTGRGIVPIKYEELGYYTDGIIKFQNGNLWGLIDRNGREIFPATYDEIEELWGVFGVFKVKIKGKYGLIDRNGNEIVPCKYDWILDTYTDLIAIRLNGLYGLVDKTGREIVPCKYDDCQPYDGYEKWSDNNYIKISYNGKKGIIDETGREIIEPKYDEINPYCKNAAFVKVNGKWGVIDKYGNVLMAPKYISDNQTINERYFQCEYYDNGLYIITQNEKKGVIDENGREIASPVYDEIGVWYRAPSTGEVHEFEIKYEDEYNHYYRFGYGVESDYSKTGIVRIPVSLNGKWGFIDETGREIVPVKYEACHPFHDGKAVVKRDGKYGFIDIDGHEKIAPKYDDADNFNEGLAFVSRNGKYGYIDADEHAVIPLKYNGAITFKEGVGAVCQGSKWMFIDRTGRQAIPGLYDKVLSNFSDDTGVRVGYAIVELNGEIFVIDHNGRRYETDDVAVGWGA